MIRESFLQELTFEQDFFFLFNKILKAVETELAKRAGGLTGKLTPGS